MGHVYRHNNIKKGMKKKHVQEADGHCTDKIRLFVYEVDRRQRDQGS